MAPAAPNSNSQVVSLTVLAEQQVLCIILAGGTIATAPLEADFADLGVQFEVVGEVESGILAAAWSPEEDLLVLVTGASELLQMTPTFDILSEAPLHAASPGEAQQVNVGWGSKSTQFHGSAGKQAAQAAPPQAVGLSPDDDRLARISWRGDSQFFSVSSVDEGKRVIRVYSRTAALQNTSEPVPGLEHTLAWKPSGALIASTQRFGNLSLGLGLGREGRHDVVFFERNGLRHGEFTLRAEKGRYRVREMSWSAGSEVLAVWIEREEGDVVQLWTVNNYHWYLKQTVHPPMPSERFTAIRWHPESSLRLTLTTATCILDRSLAWTTTRSTEPAPNDTGTVAVIEGSSLLMTPFRRMNVPPPMCGYELELGMTLEPPVDLAFNVEKDRLAVLTHGSIDVWDLQTEVENGKIAQSVKVHDLPLEPSMDARQVVLADENIAVLGYDWNEGRDAVLKWHLKDGAEWERVELRSTGSGRLITPVRGSELLFQNAKGDVLSVEDNSPRLSLPAFCFQTALMQSPPFSIVGLSAKGTLYAVSPTTTLTLATNCNSFILSVDFLVYTTSAHQAHFVPVDGLTSLLNEAAPDVPQWEQRRVERGSRIVTVVPSNMALVLQMPRGNLETVNPRPLVLRNVRLDIDRADYRSAFLACRKHRIDLNVLVDHDTPRFMKDIPQFVEQVDDPDYINLFLSGIGQSSQSAERKNEICDAIRVQLEQRDLKRYISSILTAHVVKSPSDIESGLKLLLRLRDENPEIVEEAIKYIIFLVDVDRLFNLALGMYDFSLVLMIAQHSQKDPREYLPFLRELSALKENYQRFRIDDHLKRHDKALGHLRLAGEEHWPRAKKYIESHPHLWSDALRLWQDDKAKEAELLEMYGDYLMDSKEYADAAIAFVMSHKTEKALLAYEKDTTWREVFSLATQAGASKERLAEIGARMSDKLVGKRRYTEGAQVLLDYAQNVEEAVGVLLMGNEYSEAIRIAHLHGQAALIETHIHPSALDAASNILDDLEEMSEQLSKQVARWDELQAKKALDPSGFYNDDNDNPLLHNVDVQSSASTVATNFTRYTLAPSAFSGVTGVSTSKSAKGRRKDARKRLSGKRGSVDEEMYLVSSVAKLVGRLNGLQADVGRLMPCLVTFSRVHREKARELGKALEGFERAAEGAVERIWREVEDGRKEREKQRDTIVRAGGRWEEDKLPVPVPERPRVDVVRWKVSVLV
ncbi:IkappaB kinase complex, IKAP component [Calocera viscosa TUFC12733]|uniref:Elongator complex protein 1 n=1 Tax=Calocera viscosa (strain TUFC12733) TaxID=1330018 RepID=A0A167N713_CALVF|nr:IkappaB kinase complex, IKAP component [Calocera viscosa TUFC12733]